MCFWDTRIISCYMPKIPTLFKRLVVGLYCLGGPRRTIRKWYWKFSEDRTSFCLDLVKMVAKNGAKYHFLTPAGQNIQCRKKIHKIKRVATWCGKPFFILFTLFLRFIFWPPMVNKVRGRSSRFMFWGLVQNVSLYLKMSTFMQNEDFLRTYLAKKILMRTICHKRRKITASTIAIPPSPLKFKIK